MTYIRVGFGVFASPMESVMTAHFEFGPVHLSKDKFASVVKWKRLGSRLYAPRRAPAWMSAIGNWNARWNQHPMHEYVVTCQEPR